MCVFVCVLGAMGRCPPSTSHAFDWFRFAAAVGKRRFGSCVRDGGPELRVAADPGAWGGPDTAPPRCEGVCWPVSAGCWQRVRISGRSAAIVMRSSCVGARSSQSRRTPLDNAVWWGHLELARELLDRGCPISERSMVSVIAGLLSAPWAAPHSSSLSMWVGGLKS